MQRVTVLCVGKLKERFYLEAAAEYAKRLSRYCKLELLELPRSGCRRTPPPLRSGRPWSGRPRPSGPSSRPGRF